MTDLLRELNLELTSEDFEGLYAADHRQVAERVNKILHERVKGAQKRFFNELYWSFDCDEAFKSKATYSAYLLGVREIK